MCMIFLEGNDDLMQSEKRKVGKKRAELQNTIIMIACLAMVVFVFTWLITTIVTGRKHGLLPASATVESDSSSMVSDESAGEADTSSEASEENSSVEDSSQVDTDSTVEEAASYDGAADNDDFSDACFIGDSRTVGLEMNADKPEADFYASTGLNISSAATEQVVTLENGNMGTVVDGAAQHEYQRIFIMFGINELGWPYPENFVDKYVALVEEVQEVCPTATIYIESVLPVSDKAVETNEVFTNDNIDAFNEYVEQVADQTGTVYLDINGYFKDESGKLPEDAATDGIHFVREYCLEWIDILAYLAPSSANS